MQRPRLKPVTRTIEGSRLTLTTATGLRLQIEDPDGANAKLLDLLDGSRTVDELDLPGCTKAEIAEGLALLADAGLLEDAAVSSENDVGSSSHPLRYPLYH
jgi:hypothetical protein